MNEDWCLPRSSKPFAGRCEASWVGSIPIHPRQISPVLAAMTAKVTAKITNGYLNRLGSMPAALALSSMQPCCSR